MWWVVPAWAEPDLNTLIANSQGGAEVLVAEGDYTSPLALDRTLTLRHDMHRGRPLDRQSTEEVVRHLQQLWGFEVVLESVAGDSVVSSIVHSELP